jgi:hypothetical protein
MISILQTIIDRFQRINFNSTKMMKKKVKKVRIFLILMKRAIKSPIRKRNHQKYITLKYLNQVQRKNSLKEPMNQLLNLFKIKNRLFKKEQKL